MNGENPPDGTRKSSDRYSYSAFVSHAIDPKDLAMLWNPLHWDSKEFICGWTSAFVNICLTYPINKITFRQVLHNVTPLHALKQLRSEGLFVLYRGILPPLCQKTTSLSLMFGVYESTRNPLSRMVTPNSAKVLASFISGTTECLLTPFERVQTLLQDQKYHQQFKNTRDAFYKIYVNFGLKEFYRGLTPILFRNGPSNVCFFFLRDEIKKLLEKSESAWYFRTCKEFILGGLIGAVISTCFYPLNVLKVHFQSRLGGEYQNVWSGALQIYNERGRCLSCFYRGVHLNYTRGFISWGIITAFSENVRKYL